MSWLGTFIRLRGSRQLRRFGGKPVPSISADRLPRLIWMYWETGLDTAPPLVRHCVESWTRMNPGWDVRVLDRQAVDRMGIMEGLPADLTVQLFSDVLRLRLLNRHGGVWCDATTLCGAPLDHWLIPLMGGGVFLFRRPGPDREIASWFISALPSSYILKSFETAFVQYLSEPRRKRRYFAFHYTFAYLLRTNRRFRLAASRMPVISADPSHALLFWSMRKPAKRPQRPCLRGIPVHKLNWRLRLDPQELQSYLEADAPMQELR